MRILCISDTHVGAGYEHRSDALADTDAMFAQVLALIEQRQVDLCLHAGDVFHRAKPSPAEYLCFRRFCDGLASLGVPMVAVEGNGMHSAAQGQRSALELFESRWVRVSRSPEYITAFAGVAVCTLPVAALSRLAATRGSGDRAALGEEATDLLLATARDLFASAPDDRPRVLAGHQMVSGASLPSGLPVEQVGSVVLPLWALEEQGWDAIVLGDIHKPQELSEEMPVLYCGSPMTHDFGEADVAHGCWLLESDRHGDFVSAEFIPLEDRRFVTVDVDLTDSSNGRADSHEAERGLARLHAEGELDDQEPGMRARTPGPTGLRAEASRLASGENAETSQDPIGLSPAGPALDETDQIAAAIMEQAPLTDAVVRVRYKASEAQHRRVDHAALQRLVMDAGAHRLYGGIAWQPVSERRSRAEGLDESLGPLEALGLWLEAAEVPAAEGEALRGLLGGWIAEGAA